MRVAGDWSGRSMVSIPCGHSLSATVSRSPSRASRDWWFQSPAAIRSLRPSAGSSSRTRGSSFNPLRPFALCDVKLFDPSEQAACGFQSPAVIRSLRPELKRKDERIAALEVSIPCGHSLSATTSTTKRRRGRCQFQSPAAIRSLRQGSFTSAPTGRKKSFNPLRPFVLCDLPWCRCGRVGGGRVSIPCGHSLSATALLRTHCTATASEPASGACTSGYGDGRSRPWMRRSTTGRCRPERPDNSVFARFPGLARRFLGAGVVLVGRKPLKITEVPASASLVLWRGRVEPRSTARGREDRSAHACRRKGW